MWKNILYCLIVFFFVLTVYNCAQPGRLSGGPKDTKPPKLDEEKSTKNFQTNFKKQTIELTFDEWLVLEDAFKQVVTSPPLDHLPKISLNGKTVKFIFKEEEVLKDDATYTINFGESIKDLNEKNIVKNLRFLFSTGDFIDSLQVNGSLKDAFTGEPVEDVLLMLYDNVSDTVVRKERPFYFARTNKSGTFKIENVKSDTFKVFALKDENFNYLFDLESEQIGFQDELIILSDSTQPILDLLIFTEDIPLRLLKKDSSNYGQLKLIFNQEPRGVKLSADSSLTQVQYEYEKDTIHVWYDQPKGIPSNVFITIDTLLDTVQLVYTKRADFLSKSKLRQKIISNRAVSKLNPYKSPQFTFNHPLLKFDTNSIQLFPDSIETPLSVYPRIDSSTQSLLHIDYEWEEKAKYKLLLLPGAITDIYGLTNIDTIQKEYEVVAKDQFGDIHLKIENVDIDQAYVLQLFFKKKNLVEEFSIAGDSTYQKTFKALPAGEYFLQIIEDLNRNERWDTGNYDLKLQPERKMIRPIEELRAGWEVESTISLEKFK